MSDKHNCSSDTILGQRIWLRPIALADVGEQYVAWLNDPEVHRYLETRHQPQTRAAIEAYVNRILEDQDQHLFAICLRQGGVHIGNIKVGPIHPLHRTADLSLFIGARDCWGKGYATEAIALISDYAFRVLGIEKLSAGAYAPNQRSIKAFLAAGYALEGTRRKHYRLGDERVDIVLLGACRDVWSTREQRAERA